MNLIKSNPFRKFADRHSLVYNSSFNDEAHTVVRGVTLSIHRKDRHFTTGNVGGYEITLLERTVEFKKPNREPMEYVWAIMHTRLRIVDNLPHLFLDGSNRYHEDIYEAIFTKFSRLTLATKPHQAPFMDAYRVFCNPESIPLLPELLAPELTNRLSTLGHEFDYEIIENRIYVYSPMSTTSTKELERMFVAIKMFSNWFENDPGADEF